MPVATTLKTLSFSNAIGVVNHGGAFVDLRSIDDYLEVHIPGALALFYEFGPGMAARARDCVPLDVPLVLLDLGAGDLAHAAASLRGKGFDVPGKISDGINEWSVWHGTPASTEILTGGPPSDCTILDVGDPGVPPLDTDSVSVPLERLWTSAETLRDHKRVAVAAGYGIRAALAVGILERAGIPEVSFWRTGGGRGSR